MTGTPNNGVTALRGMTPFSPGLANSPGFGATVSITITPLEAREPYIAVAAASFKMVIFLINKKNVFISIKFLSVQRQ